MTPALAGVKNESIPRFLRAIAVLPVVLAVVAASTLTPAHARVPRVASKTEWTRIGPQLRTLLETGSLADAVLAAALLERDAVQPTATLKPSLVPPATPAAIARPVALLLAALGEAQRLTRGSVPHAVDFATARQSLDEAAARLREWRPGSPPPRLPDALAPHVTDRPALARALLVLARAIDAALPDLRRYAESLSTSSARVDGCDVVDASPLLCIGGEAANTYTHEAALTIDLGGNDVYLNSSGGALPLETLPVVVSIDLAGNDRYLTPPASRGGPPVAQGAGALGGVGVLVDVAGDDLYRSDAFAQGSGLLGAGMLADLEGNDRYHLDSRLGTDVWAVGQGMGGGPGYGILLDGGGDDVYTADAYSRPDPENPSSSVGSVTWAHGWALGGTALVWDAGGKDYARVSARSVAHDDAGPPSASGFATAQYPGTAAAVISGDGPTVRRLVTSQRGRTAKWWTSVILGFGAATLGDLGLLFDGGGDDRYELISTTRAASASGGVWIWGLGFGLGGAGVIHDAAGNDRYRVHVVAEGSSRSITSLFSVDALAAGPGGQVVDEGGNDRYDVSLVNAVRGLWFDAAVQGARGGQLIDLGGADRYAAYASTGNVRERDLGPVWGAQGARNGTLVDVDDGAPDRFLVNPRPDVCSGKHGQGVWVSCDGGTGIAVP